MLQPISPTKLDWRDYAQTPFEARCEHLAKYGRVSAVRTMRQFAEEDVVIPDGDFVGQLFRVRRQPVHGLWFDEIDSGHWSRFSFVACQQSGKTLAGFVIPAMYHLFETQETVIVGLPTMDIARDKWEVDIKPAIEASRFAEYLPSSGPGSKGGTPELITFKNGAHLKFMSGGGGDEKRSAFTSRVLVVTEADKLDETGAGSDEGTKLRQLEGRTRFYGNRKRVYLECTVSEESGCIWQEWLNGSAGLVHLPCPGCGEYVAPERDNFVMWEEAEEEIDAEGARFSCPACGEVWSEEQRHRQLQNAKVIHRGQECSSSGKVSGDLPRTRTCGFRYSAALNAFADTAMIGVDEWKAKRAIDEDLADRELLQWTWAWPPEPRVKTEEPLDVQTLMMRQSNLPRQQLPDDVQTITAGVDARKEQLEWFVVASRGDGGPLCVDYGYEPVPVHKMDLSDALKAAVSELQTRFDYGWQIGTSGERRSVDLVLLDSHWETDALYEACWRHPLWTPAMGFGFKQHRAAYLAPKKKDKAKPVLGDAWHMAEMKRLIDGRQRKFLLAEMNADVWKGRLHRSLSVDVDHPHALLLPKSGKPDGRKSLAKQLTAERQVSEYVAGKGTVTKWESVFYLNHWLDAAYMALVGQSVMDLKKTIAAQETSARRQSVSSVKTPHGQPFFVGNR